jgi:hypothetical protein
MGGGGSAGADAAFGIPTQGPSGWRGLVQNKKALGLATFASLGGVLYVSLGSCYLDLKMVHPRASGHQLIFGAVIGLQPRSICPGSSYVQLPIAIQRDPRRS